MRRRRWRRREAVARAAARGPASTAPRKEASRPLGLGPPPRSLYGLKVRHTYPPRRKREGRRLLYKCMCAQSRWRGEWHSVLGKPSGKSTVSEN